MLVNQHGFDPRKGFTKVPNVILFDGKLTAMDVRTYAALAAFCWHGKAVCWLSLRALAELTGASKDTVRRSLERLAEYGIILVERSGTGKGDTNRYTLQVLPDDKGSKISRKGSSGATRSHTKEEYRSQTNMLSQKSDEYPEAVSDSFGAREDSFSSLDGVPGGTPSFEADEGLETQGDSHDDVYIIGGDRLQRQWVVLRY